MNQTKTVLKLDKSHSLYLPMIIPLFISIKTKQLHLNNPTMSKHVLLFHSIIIQQRIDFWRKATTNSKCASIQEINNIRMKSEILLELMLVVDFILMSILIKQQQKKTYKMEWSFWFNWVISPEREFTLVARDSRRLILSLNKLYLSIPKQQIIHLTIHSFHDHS